jgi:hypothetical protein
VKFERCSMGKSSVCLQVELAECSRPGRSLTIPPHMQMHTRRDKEGLEREDTDRSGK